MADEYGYDGSVGDEEYDEEEVWALVKGKRDESPKARRSKDAFSSSSSSSTPTRIPSSYRTISRSNAHGEGHSRSHRQSTPINIPDWSEIYGYKGSSEGHRFRNSGRRADGDEEGRDRAVDDHEDDDEDDGKVPPHEWIAKKLARSQISSFSVCEGAGRTLKGRDLRKVRDAVLTRTGFIE